MGGGAGGQRETLAQSRPQRHGRAWDLAAGPESSLVTQGQWDGPVENDGHV